jgi:hypothetical protein
MRMVVMVACTAGVPAQGSHKLLQGEEGHDPQNDGEPAGQLLNPVCVARATAIAVAVVVVVGVGLVRVPRVRVLRRVSVREGVRQDVQAHIPEHCASGKSDEQVVVFSEQGLERREAHEQERQQADQRGGGEGARPRIACEQGRERGGLLGCQGRSLGSADAGVPLARVRHC